MKIYIASSWKNEESVKLLAETLETFNKHSDFFISHGEIPLMDYDRYEKAVRELLAAQSDGWIPVEEPPEEKKKYLCYTSRYQIEGWFLDGTWFDVNGQAIVNKVTYYRERPAPPTQQEDGK